MAALVLCVSSTADRLDRYISGLRPELSRAVVQALIRDGNVMVNGHKPKASYRPSLGDEILIDLPRPPEATPLPERIALDVLYEDEHLLVVNKPPGLVVHPAPGHRSGTLVNALLGLRPSIRGADLDPSRPGIVHRIDRDTSGIVLVAATRESQRALQAQFKDRSVTKVYKAILCGRLTPETGMIDAPVSRDPRHRQRMSVVWDGGRPALTEYRTIALFSDATVVEARLHTGRTHQLRVHFSSIHHPILGDRVYGRQRDPVSVRRQMLHAWRLAFRHPVGGDLMEIEAPLPEDFLQVVRLLGAVGR